MRAKEFSHKSNVKNTEKVLPWIWDFFHKGQLLEVYVESPDAEFFTSNSEDLFHLETILILEKHGNQLCEVGMTDDGNDLNVFPETVLQALYRLGEKANDAWFALVIQNASTAFIFPTPPGCANLYAHAVTCTRGRV